MAADENLSIVQFPGYNTRNAAPEIVGPAWSGLGMWGGPRGSYGDYYSGYMSQLYGMNEGMGMDLTGTYAGPGNGVDGESSN